MSSSSPSSSSSSDQPHPQHFCYVHCTICDTVLAVSVPSTNLFSVVTVRCGHCTTLLTVDVRLLFQDFGQNLFSHRQNLTVEIENPNSNYLAEEVTRNNLLPSATPHPRQIGAEVPQPLEEASIRTPSIKRQRTPSAYNRFIKEEIQRIKAENPNIAHREAFSAAAKNWAHYPHIQFGLMSNPMPRMSFGHYYAPPGSRRSSG